MTIKAKTSKIKKNNIKKTKLYKQGKIKKKKKQTHSSIPSKCSQKPDREEFNHEDPSAFDSENMLQMIDKKDLDFLKVAVHDPGYTLYSQGSVKQKERKKRKYVSEIDYIEEEYEKEVQSENKNPKRTRHLLPIKTPKGLVRRTIEEEIPENENDDHETEEGPEEESHDTEYLPEVDEDEDLERPLSTADILARREHWVSQYKLRIGILASGLLEDPQKRVKNIAMLLDTMIHCKAEVRFTVQKLVILSLTEVFKDILPSYQIKHQENSSVKLKKDTKTLHDFEKSLLKGYRLFLMRLERHAKVLQKKRGDTRVRSEQELKVGEMALGCVVDLLEKHPYFNYNRNIVQMLTPNLDHPRESVRVRVASGFSRIFKDDKRGEITLDIVRRINHLVKSRSHAVHKEVISVLLALRIKDVNLDQEKEAEIKQKKFMTHKQKLLAMSKRERKRSKKLEELEKELLETKAEENKENKQKNLTEVMKVVFTIYFRILKKAPSSKVLSTALEGLAKFAHCINVEFFADLVSVLDDLMEGNTLQCRERLHCVQTVFAILSGQGESLNIDPSRFYTHLYNNILHIHAGRTHEDIKIVLRIMEVVLIQRRKKITHQRLLAFTKRLAILSTQLLHNGAVGALSLVRRVMQIGMGVDVLLDVDSTLGQGIYNPELREPEHCNAASTALWELTLLQRHYHPTVRLVAQQITTISQDNHNNSQLPADLVKLDSTQLFEAFDPSLVEFKPSVPAPAKNISGNVKVKQDSTYVQQLLKEFDSPPQAGDLHLLHREVFKHRKKNVKGTQ